jgi:hypothetical protein
MPAITAAPQRRKAVLKGVTIMGRRCTTHQPNQARQRSSSTTAVARGATAGKRRSGAAARRRSASR